MRRAIILEAVGDVASFAWLRASGWAPLPWNLDGLYGSAFCRLWGVAYFDGAVESFGDWWGYWRPHRLGGTGSLHPRDYRDEELF